MNAPRAHTRPPARVLRTTPSGGVLRTHLLGHNRQTALCSVVSYATPLCTYNEEVSA
jgi:hypothetical protein